jgi:hypothetical protein
MHFATKRRSQLLAVAREILTSNDTNTVEVCQATERGGLYALSEGKQKGFDAAQQEGGKTGKEGQETTAEIFDIPACHISIQAQMLVELCYQTIGESQAHEPGM